MDKIQKSALKEKIRTLITNTKSAIADMEEMTKPVTPENSIGRISRMDAINNKSVMEATLAKSRQKLSKLEMALNNIDKDNFGICNRCGHAIQDGRLIFMPESTDCIRCADR